MKKKLPFDSNIIIKTYPYFADYLGILMGHKMKIDEFIINNFFSIIFIPITGQINFSKKKNLKKMFLTQSYQTNKDTIVDFVKKNIDENKYVVILLNDKNFNREMEHPLGVHSWLIYGYDDYVKTVNICGYIIENGCNIYKEIDITFQDLEKALPSNLTRTERNRLSSNHICELPDNILLENKKLEPKIERIVYNLSLKNSIVFFLIRLHNYVYSIIKINPYKRNFLDLRDMRILYEQTIAIDLYLKTHFPFVVCESEENIKLCQNNLIIATKFRLMKNNKDKKLFCKKINNNLKKINRNQVLISKKIHLNRKEVEEYDI